MAGLRERVRGPWRIAVAEASMTPAILDGDWLLVDPTTTRWPRRGAVVVFREPDGEALAIKRVAGRPGDRIPFRDGYLELADDEAWLLSDATPDATAAEGHGEPIDSRRYGPVPVALLVGRAWFRYWPPGRIGPISRPAPPPPPPDPG
jgi:signal peptidase I